MIRKQEELARMAEVGEDDFRGPVGTDQSTSQAPLHFDPSGRSNKVQGTRVQASRDQDQQTPGQGRGRNGNRPHGSMEALTQAEAARERREGKKGPATAGLLTPVPNANKRKNKD